MHESYKIMDQPETKMVYTYSASSVFYQSVSQCGLRDSH